MSFFTPLSGSGRRVPLFSLLMLAFLLLSGTGYAQDFSAISLYSVGKEDGNLSMFLPIGWTFIDDLDTTNGLAFGDSEEAAQTRFKTLGTMPEGLTIVGSGGTFRFYTREALKLTDESTVEDLANIVNEMTDTTTSSIYQEMQMVAMRSGAAAYIMVHNGDTIEIIAALFYGSYVGYAVMSAPADDFDTVSPQLMAVLDSVRIPGETLLTMPDETQGVSSYNDLFSVRVPKDWTYQYLDHPAIHDAVAFGSSMWVFDDAAAYTLDGRANVLNTAGIGGYVALLGADALDAMKQDAETAYEDLQVPLKALIEGTTKPWTIPGIEAEGILYYGYEKGDSYYDALYLGRVVGLMIIDDDVLEVQMWVNPSHDFRRSLPLIEGIIASLTFPAIMESEIDSFGRDASFTPTPFDISGQTPDENGLVEFVSRNQQVSLRLPPEWIIKDQIDMPAALNMVSFGETAEGAEIRGKASGSAEDIGGSLAVATFRELSVSPYPPNNQLIGYIYRWAEDNNGEILQEPKLLLLRGKRIVYAIYQLNMTEWGFIAVHDFGSHFIVTRVTVPSKDGFNENSALLGAIVDSVDMPSQHP